MSAELSRRLARVALEKPIAWLGYPDRRDIACAAERAKDFADLPERFQRPILAAEAERERRIAAGRAKQGSDSIIRGTARSRLG